VYFGLKTPGKIVKKIYDLNFPGNPGKNALHICYGRITDANLLKITFFYECNFHTNKYA
jgi:hypothetical protein